MKKLHQIATENSFKYTKVSAEEYEDGVGAVVGANWVKDQVFYTTSQMIAALGLPEAKIKSVDLDASVGFDNARKMAIDWLKNQNATWYEIFRHKYTFGRTAITVSVRYG